MAQVTDWEQVLLTKDDSDRNELWQMKTPSGEKRLTMIGEGAFSRVFYQFGAGENLVYAVVRDPGYDKMVMALAREMAPQNRYLPDVRRIGRVPETLFIQHGQSIRDDGGELYTMPWYETGSRPKDFLNPESEKFYGRMAACLPAPSLDLDVAADCLRRKRFRGEQKEAIDAVLEAAYSVWLEQATEYNAYFDLPARNIATNSEGDLILLDPIYFLEGG